MEMTPMPPTPAPRKNATNIILMILVPILILGNIVTLYFLFSKPAIAPTSNSNTALDVNENVNDNAPVDTDDDVVVDDKFADLEPLQVVWENPIPVQLASLVDNYDNLAQYAGTLDSDSGMTFADFIKNAKLYRVGKIQNYIDNGDGTKSYKAYHDAELFVATTPQYGPSFRPNFYRIIKYNDRVVLLTAQSDSLDYDIFMQLFVSSEEEDYYLANLETPKEISIPNSKYGLLKDADELKMLKQDFDYNNEAENVFANVYRTRNCYFAVAGDGSVRIYYLRADIFNNIIGGLSVGHLNQVLNITWNDSITNKNEYKTSDTPIGCGAPGCYDFADYISGENMLKVAGVSSDGSTIYELKDVNTKADGADKVSILQQMYDIYYPGYDEKTKSQLPKISFEQFLTEHPLIFWQDPFGKFIVFKNSKYVPAAECGKPVIYLYPSETTDVSVKVSPTGGFSKTEPEYGSGWLVKAEPNGALYNYTDQKIYPYLFWEGYALDYAMADEGFVVAKDDVNSFLREKLAIQGLNTQEINDFMEFWLPRMQSDSYYFVTFVPQAEFDKMAPLSVSPQPDSIIRVFMDFKALTQPIEVTEQKLSTPTRTGFTVVEWGGELRK